ncbi:hypothetical protein [Aquimarina sediminis]|uniref:hypothetical protein n=1 Tax=Aquimarina sediminis TaxID=2070536 RepID=UPI000FFE5267|nr:hypothetical protein [Aquimarina sediminis]
MEIEGMSWAVFWEDEGLPTPSLNLTRAFVYVIHYRTFLIVGNKNETGNYGPKYFNKLMFKLAKVYFPDWIGFNKGRCSYNPELGNRVLRIQKVAEWKLNKMFDNE